MRESIHTLLSQFRGLDPLKRLFWQELNYDRVNQPASTRDWSDDERAALDGEPLLFAEHGEFRVIYLRMRGDLGRTAERTLINRLLQAFPYALFVFSNNAQDRWHFINVKYERDPSRRRVFRRITVVAGSDQFRTATERITMLDLETVSRDLYGIPPLAIQQRHDQAFDVEAVTREFFRAYDKIFRRVEACLTTLPEDVRRLFTQRLFNRLMFLVFLERKGWLIFKGRTDYLLALWEDYNRTKEQTGQENFYWNRLYHLFFSGLNNPKNLIVVNEGDDLADLIGNVPYLNGGLFERNDDDDNRAIVIPDAVFQSAVEDLFYRFNFTIAESTPLDIEVAVDPEMLGKIFEELVTGRHESGSYYTPKPVVSFMCREALKGFLRSALPSETADVIAGFVDEYDATRLRDPEATLRALQRVAICDPACGSGAYLLGMMQELLLLRQALFTARNVDGRTMYERKLEIIQNNIYGVDKDPFATNVAQLRLWLSLIVDFERGREGAEPPTLPNLDYKIEAGDSLLGPDPSGETPREFDRLLVDDYVQAKDLYLKSHGVEKKQLHREVERLQSSIRTWARGGGATAGFDWAIEFAEVFDDGGFDIVLANPPYVRQELIKDIKPTLKQVYGAFFSGTADLFTYFYARAVQMLKTDGMLVFISSNKWLRANYGVNLRRYLADNMHVISLTDFGELPVFQTAATFPLIFVAQRNSGNQTATMFTQVKTLGEPYPDVRTLIEQQGEQLPPEAISGETWTLTDAATAKRLRQMGASSIPLGKYVNGKIYRGILTGFNTAFIINGATRAALIAQDPKSEEIIKILAVGDDVRKWRITDKNRWLIITPIGIDIKHYHAVFSHLQQWQSDLEKRHDKGNHWWELRACDYYPMFDKPKIVFPEIAKEPRFAYDTESKYTNNKAFIIPLDDLYLLAVLNSTSAWEYTKQICSVLGDENKGGRVMLQWVNFKRLPIPNASDVERMALAALSQRCLDKQGVGCEAEEREINERVARLYGVNLVKE